MFKHIEANFYGWNALFIMNFIEILKIQNINYPTFLESSIFDSIRSFYENLFLEPKQIMYENWKDLKKLEYNL